MSEKNETVHAKMAKIKAELSKIDIKKSGHNKYAGFKYHELQDFMVHINQLNAKYGVNDFVEIDEDKKECRITIVNCDDPQDFYVLVSPFREAQMLAKGGAPSNVDVIQRMGSTITYNRRYLYMTAYNITESDAVDSAEPKQPQTKPAPKGKPKVDFVKAVEAIKAGKTTVAEIVKIRECTLEEIAGLNEVEQSIKNK